MGVNDGIRPSAGRSMTRSLRRLPLVASSIMVGLGVIALTLLAMRLTGRDDAMFTRDVRAVASDEGVTLPIYAGLISILNNLIWAAAAALTLCAAGFDRARRRWHVAFGGLLLVIAADDSYMLHESGGSRWLELGFYAMYAMVGAWLLLAGLRTLDGNSGLTFVIGTAFIAVAAYTDVATRGLYLAEDGAKLIGSLVWLTIPISTLTRARTRDRYEISGDPVEPRTAAHDH
jgi:hypothetical protein